MSSLDPLPAFLEERREVAQERVCGEAVGGGLLLLLGRQVVGDVEERLKKRRCRGGGAGRARRVRWLAARSMWDPLHCR